MLILTSRVLRMSPLRRMIAVAGVRRRAGRPGTPRASQQAVVVRRRLAQANPAAYDPALAMSLNNLLNRLAEAAGGRRA
jgi:hypothetical protein